MPRYSISNVPTEVVGPYAVSGVFRERLGDKSAGATRQSSQFYEHEI